MKCIIVGSGEIKDYSILLNYINNESYVICCDGGLNHLKKLNIIPEIILGDFDSVDNNVLDFYKNLNVNIVRFPTEKNFTDMELGLVEAIKLSPKEILIFGGIGSRLDHFLGNLELLYTCLNKNITAKLINENNIILLCNDKIVLKKELKYFSIIPFFDIVKIKKCKGIKYPISYLKSGETLGVSNEIIEDQAYIEISEGIAIIIQSKD